jgi:hypothetical protein
MTRSMHPHPGRPDLTVLLVADPPPPERRPGAGTPAGRHEALVALARAVFAEGGRLAAPVDVDIALVLGTVALDYSAPPVAERRGEAPPAQLTVKERQPEPLARTLLAPLAVRGALRYLDEQGSEVRLDLTEVTAEQPGLAEVHRHHVTPLMVQVTQPRAAVFISPTRPATEDLAVLRAAQVRTVVFHDSVLEPGVNALMGDVEDPTERLLQGGPGERWSPERRPEEEEVRPVPPYPYLMQRLVAELTGRYG